MSSTSKAMAHILEIYAPTFAAKQKIGKVGSKLTSDAMQHHVL